MNDTFSDFDLTRFLPYRMTVAAEKLSVGMSKHYRDTFGISVAEWRVLVHLADAGEVSVRELERQVHLEKSKASRAASRLEAAGYVCKEVNEKDRRLLVLTLTAAGRHLMADLLQQAIAYQDRLDRLLQPHLDALDEVFAAITEEDL